MSSVYRFCVTRRCWMRCPWCDVCGGPQGEHASHADARPPPRREGVVARLHGGDPFLHPDLSGWVRWAATTGARVEIDANAASLVERPVPELPRGVSAHAFRFTLPSTSADDLGSWTGVRELCDATFRAIETCLARGDAVSCVVPVSPLNVHALAGVARAISERYGAAVPVVLRRPRRVAPGALGAELPALAEALRALADVPAGSLCLRFDELDAYPPCGLPREVWRQYLFEASARPGERPRHDYPAPERCARCAVQPRCEFRPEEGAAWAPLLAPLDAQDATSFERITGDPELGPFARQFAEGECDFREGRLNAAYQQLVQVARSGLATPAVAAAAALVGEIERRLRARLAELGAQLRAEPSTERWVELRSFVEEHLHTPVAEQGAVLVARSAPQGAPPLPAQVLDDGRTPAALLGSALRVEPTPDPTGLAAPLLGPVPQRCAAALRRAGAAMTALGAARRRVAEAAGCLVPEDETLPGEVLDKLTRELDGDLRGQPVLRTWLAALEPLLRAPADLPAAVRFLDCVRLQWLIQQAHEGARD